MTSPLAPAAPAPTPTAASPAATDAPGGGERFASALDDAVAGGQGGPRGQEPAAEGEGTPAEPTAEVPAGEQPVTGPGVSPAGMPPALWVLLTGIGPGAAAPVALDGAAPVAPDATPPVAPAGDAAPPVGPAGDAAPAAGAVPALPTVAGSVAGILPTMFDGRTVHANEVLSEIKASFPGQVFDVVIKDSVRVKESPAAGLSILDYDRNHDVAKAYLKLAGEVDRG